MDLDLQPWPEASPNPLVIFSTVSDSKHQPYAAREIGDVVLREYDSDQKSPRTEIIVSLGLPEKINPETFRRVGGLLSHWFAGHNVPQCFIDVEQIRKIGVQGAFSAVCEGLLLGAFQFYPYKSNKVDRKPICVHLITRGSDGSLPGELSKTTTLGTAVNLARAWGHEPGNVINPVTLSDWVKRLCEKTNLECTILDDKDLTKMGAGGLLTVGKGSQTPPRMITIRYPGNPSRSPTQPVVLVGKAVTFDSGGYSLKAVNKIQGMKYDKAGAMAVIGVMAAAAELKVKHPIVAVLPVAENLVSDHSYRPDDIITLLSGKTVEVVTTDAEGRLIMADALTYAQQEFQPRYLIDIATLTSGIVTALGRVRAGLFSNDDRLADQLVEAGDRTHELLWRMPLDAEYLANMRSEEADVKNSGGTEGHPVYGGVFLNHFVHPDVPWAHLDITGMAETNNELAYCPKGATGFGVRLLVDFFQHLEG